MLLKLEPHQIKAVDFALKNPYSILALDMGLGKTAVALAIMEKVGGSTLVVCPAHLIPNWRAEISKFLGPDVPVAAMSKGSDIYYVWDSDIILVSYNLVQKARHFLEWCDTLIIEEAHELKSMKAKKTEYLHKEIYENSIKRVHLLTGTPIKNRVEEFYSLIAICYYNPALADAKFLTKFPDSISFADYFSFRRQYTIEINGRRVQIVKWEGIRNIPELKHYLKGIYLRMEASDILDLPPISFKDVLISETPDLELLRVFEKHFEDEDNGAVSPDKKVEAALKKVPFTTTYVKGLLEEIDSVIIFSDQVEPCKALASAFGVTAIHAGVSKEERHRLATDFQNGVGRVLCATIKTFSTGYTLTRSANIVENDPSWIPGDQDQMWARIVRMGQKRHCTGHRIHGSPQDRYINEAVREKRKTIKAAT